MTVWGAWEKLLRGDKAMGKNRGDTVTIKRPTHFLTDQEKRVSTLLRQHMKDVGIDPRGLDYDDMAVQVVRGMAIELATRVLLGEDAPAAQSAAAGSHTHSITPNGVTPACSCAQPLGPANGFCTKCGGLI